MLLDMLFYYYTFKKTFRPNSPALIAFNKKNKIKKGNSEPAPPEYEQRNCIGQNV